MTPEELAMMDAAGVEGVRPASTGADFDYGTQKRKPKLSDLMNPYAKPPSRSRSPKYSAPPDGRRVQPTRGAPGKQDPRMQALVDAMTSAEWKSRAGSVIGEMAPPPDAQRQPYMVYSADLPTEVRSFIEQNREGMTGALGIDPSSIPYAWDLRKMDPKSAALVMSWKQRRDQQLGAINSQAQREVQSEAAAGQRPGIVVARQY